MARSSQQFFMSDARLPEEVHLGFVLLKNAHKLTLSELYVSLSANEIVIKWEDEEQSFVTIYMYRLPGGRAAFNENVAWFSKDCKKRVRFPGGAEFRPRMLAIREAPASWVHDGFARSPRDVIHTYRSDRHAMLIRYRSQDRTILDNPLLRRIHKNLLIIEEQWVVAYP